jgi:hypothetical protein
MRGYRISKRSLALTVTLLAFPLSALARDDFITLDLGGYLFHSRNDISVGGLTGRGSDFRLERQGAPGNDTVLRLDGTIRPFERHRIRFMWLDSSRSGSGQTDRTISFRDATYALGTRVNTSFQLQQAELDYMYSFWKSDTTEVALSLGVHAAKMDARLTAPAISLDREASATGPLPMVGVAVNYKPHEKWELLGHVYGMSARVNDFGGTAVAYRVGARYFFTPNIGVGVAWAGINYNFDLAKTSWQGALDASHSGGQAFLTFRY